MTAARPHHRLTWLAALLIFAACDSPERPADAPADSAAVITNESPAPADSIAPLPLREYIAQGAIAHGLTRADLIERFGAADSVSAIAQPNRHDPSVTDSISTLVYPGARYVYYVVTQGPGEILDAAHVTSNEHLRHARPGIGASAADVRRAFGTPLRATSDRLEYECTTCEVPEPVTFVMRDDRVVRIEFDYYVD